MGQPPEYHVCALLLGARVAFPWHVSVSLDDDAMGTSPWPAKSTYASSGSRSHDQLPFAQAGIEPSIKTMANSVSAADPRSVPRTTPEQPPSRAPTPSLELSVVCLGRL